MKVTLSNKHLLWLNIHSSANVILNSLTTLTTLNVLGFDNNQIPKEAEEELCSTTKS